LLDYRGVRGIRFTLPFGKAITIAATCCRHEAAGRDIESLTIFREIKAPGGDAAAGNEGVGEHVRTKSQPTRSAGEIADLWIRTDEENCFLLPNRF
jgi:hypothetical protein